MSDKNGGFGTFFSGFVLGGIAGAVAVFLTAPRSGLETREQIRARSSQLQGTAQRTVDDVLTTVKAAALDVSNRTEELRVQNQAALEQAQKQWAEAIADIKNVTSEAIDEMKTTVAEATEKTEQTIEEAE